LNSSGTPQKANEINPLSKKNEAATAAVRDADEQVLITFTDEVNFDEWKMTFLPGQSTTVRAALLSDLRLVGKFEEA
jgi:hypothetical protein